MQSTESAIPTMTTMTETKYDAITHLRQLVTFAYEAKKPKDLVAFAVRAGEVAKKIQA